MSMFSTHFLLQEVTPEATSGDLFSLLARSYGVAAPAIIGLGFLAWTLWRRLISVQDEMVKILHANADKVVPTLVDATNRMDQNSQMMERVAVMMHQLAGRPYDADLTRRLIRILEEAEDQQAPRPRRRTT